MRQSIGLKILSVALLMVALMAIVAGISSWYPEKIADQAVRLVKYHMPIQQRADGAARAAASELLHFERYINLLRADAMGTRVLEERMSVTKRAAEVDRLISEAVQIMVEADRHDSIKQDAAFAQLGEDLPRIARAHQDMSVAVQAYLAQAENWTPVSAEDELRMIELRQQVSRAITNVTALLDALTTRSAEKTLELEESARLFTWTVTAIAALVGLLIAGLITRFLVRPVHALVAGTKAVHAGNLDVHIKVGSNDEIGALAESFNHMIGGLKQKEAIQNTFGKYVDPRIVKSLLENEDMVNQGQRRRMTVSFSDLQGFTGLCERTDPEAIVRFLNHYFTHMSHPIRAQSGIIDKYIGDSVMAFWGPPFVGDIEHPLAACRAAVAQIRGMQTFRRELPVLVPGLPNNLDIHTRIGISTGDVTVGNIGSDESRGYTVIGDTVNLAARLEGACKQYGTSIIISEDTWLAAHEGLDTRELDKIRVVGKNEPVRIFEVLGLKHDADPATRELAEIYEAALSNFRHGNMGLARDGFAEGLARAPMDKPARVFLDRIARIEHAGLPSDWDGVWTMQEK